jgi:hypothetical protein
MKNLYNSGLKKLANNLLDKSVLFLSVKQSLYTPWRRLGGEEV